MASPCHLEAGSPPMSSPSTRPPNRGDDAVSPFGSASVSWVGAPLLPAGPDEGGVAAVFRGSGVRVTSIQPGRALPAGQSRDEPGWTRR